MKVTFHSENYTVVIDTLGAELKSFRTPEGKEFIWNSDPRFWMRSSPLLFPTIGNLRDNKTIIDGTEYPLQKHGFCKESEFTIERADDESATFLLTDSGATLPLYPFHFELRLTYALTANRLAMTYQVKNTDTREIFYHIGAHPGFMCSLEDGETLSDYRLEFEKEENLDATVYDLEHLCFSSTKKRRFGERSRFLPLHPDMFDNDAILFPHTSSHSVKLVNPSTGKGVLLSYPGFVSIAFWTLPEGRAPFLCLEPWNGAAIYNDEDDVFCHKRDIITLPEGENAVYELSIELLDQ